MAPSRGVRRGGVEDMDSSQASSSYNSSEGMQQEVEWTWKRAALVVAKLWCVGFWDACCLNRAYYCCRRSKRVLKKTGQCFLLNVVAFLGSIFALQKGVSPFVRWVLIAPRDNSELTSNGLLANFIVFVLYLCWLCPLYFASFVLNCLWYNEIAAHGFVALKKQASESSAEPGTPSKEKSSSGGRSKSNSAIESLVMRIGEQIYSVIMLTFFFFEVWLLSYIPYVGQLLKFILMSWLYAYYCFDYKWGLCRWSLEKRLLFFESNWAFFAGFGSPCVLATFFLSPLVGGGVMAVVFPIFVLVATASDPEAATNYCLSGKQSGLPRLHLFYVANKITVPSVRFLQTYWSTSAARKKSQ